MKKLMAELGVRYEFVEAVDGQKLSKKQIEQVYDDVKSRNTIGRALTPGEIGACLSHLSLYQKIVDQKLPLAFIMEDDIEAHENFIPLLRKILQGNHYFDLLLFAYGHSKNYANKLHAPSFWGRILLFKNYFLVRFWRTEIGAQGYLLTNQGAQKLIHSLSAPNKFFQQIDCYTGNPRLLHLRGVFPPLIQEKPRFGNQTTIKLRTDCSHKISNFVGFRARVEKILLKNHLSFVRNFYLILKTFFLRCLPPPFPK